jgi:hypothetical protein
VDLALVKHLLLPLTASRRKYLVKPMASETLESNLLVVGSAMYELDQLSTHSVHFKKCARLIRIVLSLNPYKY